MFCLCSDVDVAVEAEVGDEKGKPLTATLALSIQYHKVKENTIINQNNSVQFYLSHFSVIMTSQVHSTRAPSPFNPPHCLPKAHTLRLPTPSLPPHCSQSHYHNATHQ